MKIRSVKLNFIMNVMLTLSSFIFPLITYPYVSRILRPEGIGSVSFAQSIVSYFAMLAALGIPSYGIRLCAQNRDDKEKLSQSVHELLLINMIMVCVSYLLLACSIIAVPKLKDERLLILICSMSILFDTVGIEWMYKGLEQYSYITIRSLCFKVISVGLMLLLIHTRKDYIIYGAITVFASSASGIINFLYAKKFIYFRVNEKLRIKQHIPKIIVFFAMTCATTIYTNLDTVMLGFMKSNTDVGYYNAAVKIKILLVAFVTSLGTVLLPRASYYIEKKETQKFYSLIKKSLNFVFVVSVPLSIYFTLFSKYGVLFLSGNAFFNAVPSMQVIMPTVFFIGISNITGIQVLVPLGKEKYVLYSEISGAIVDVILNLLLIPKFAATGAAMGTVTAEAIVLTVQIILIRKSAPEYLKAFTGLQYWKIFAAVFMGVIASLWCMRLEISAIFVLCISSVCFFGVYAFTLVVLREEFSLEVLNGLIERVKSIKLDN